MSVVDPCFEHRVYHAQPEKNVEEDHQCNEGKPPLPLYHDRVGPLLLSISIDTLEGLESRSEVFDLIARLMDGVVARDGCLSNDMLEIVCAKRRLSQRQYVNEE